MTDEIEKARDNVERPERNVRAQRWRVATLNGNASAKWLAEQLLAGSEHTLRRHREDLERLLEAERRRGECERNK